MWRYTPRRINAYLHFARKRQRHDLATQLALSANAARAEPKELKKQLKELQRDV